MMATRRRPLVLAVVAYPLRRITAAGGVVESRCAIVDRKGAVPKLLVGEYKALLLLNRVDPIAMRRVQLAQTEDVLPRFRERYIV